MPAEPVIVGDAPVLLFGGPYGNRQATRAVLDEARRRGIPANRIVCTGDLVAYCGAPVETIACVRESGIHVVLGNCDEQLGAGADDCGCGFGVGTTCDRLSVAWYTYANSVVGNSDRQYLASFPRSLDIVLGGARLRVIHGGLTQINAFIFASTPIARKRSDLDLAAVDGFIGGHCGLPFSEVIDGRLWHNPGVIGMPANDGTPRVWYSVLTPLNGRGLRVTHHALTYDHVAAAADMDAAGLPRDYRDALSSGLWPSLDILPPTERAATGVAINETSFIWHTPAALAASGGRPIRAVAS